MTEAARHQLYEALKEHLGVAPADTLMDAIPPVGWADVATKRDLDVLERDLRAEINLLRSDVRAELNQVRADVAERLGDLQRNLFFGFLAAQGALAALIINVAG